MYNIKVSSTRKMYNNYHVSSEQNMERELQLKSQLLDGTQESFTATVSKLSMIEQELEMLKIDQYGKIDSYQQHKQSSSSNSNLYPYLQNEEQGTPFAQQSPHPSGHESHNSQYNHHSQHHHSAYDSGNNEARRFLSEFTSPTRMNHHPSPANEHFLHPSTNGQDSHMTSSSLNQTMNFHSQGLSQFNLPPPVDPFDNLVSKSEVLTQQLYTQQQKERFENGKTSLSTSHNNTPIPPHIQADELLQRFKQITSPSQQPPTAGVNDIVDENVSDAEVAMMQSELARTCKRENVMQEEHRQSCLALQDSWEKLSRLRKHIAEFRGAIEETTIEDIHHQTNQWQLNTYRENNAPSASHMLKYYGSDVASTNKSSPLMIEDSQTHDFTNGHNQDEKDKLTSMLLGLDVDEEQAKIEDSDDNFKDRNLQDIPYIDHPQASSRIESKSAKGEDERVADESARIIHLQVLREKVRMRDALRAELANTEDRLNQTRKELDDASNFLISSSQVAAEQRGGMAQVSKGAREKVASLSTNLSDIEVTYLNLTQQLLTIETELRSSLEELHMKEQKQLKLISQNDLSLLTEVECDRLIRESQSAMAAKSGIFTWSNNPNKEKIQQKDIKNAADIAIRRSSGGGGNRTTTLTLDEILSGKAKLTRMNGERAASFRARLQKRLGGMLVILGQLQAEVDEKTMAVKVARERLRECEVKRLRLELQMAHIGSILQKRRENAKMIRESYNHDADKPDVLTDESGRNSNGVRSQRTYHKNKADQTYHATSPAHVKHQPSTGNGYHSPTARNGPFHMSELDSTEECKSPPLLTKEEEVRDKTKMMMSLAGNLLNSEYAKDTSLAINDENDSDNSVLKRDCPLDQAVRETSEQFDRNLNRKEDSFSSRPPKEFDMSDDGDKAEALSKKSKKRNIKRASQGIIEDDEPVSDSVVVENSAWNSGRQSPEKQNLLPNEDSTKKIDQSGHFSRKATASKPKSRLSKDKKNLEDKDQKLDKRPPLKIEYDRNGRKLIRSKSGELIPSRKLRNQVSTTGAATGRYSKDVSIKESDTDREREENTGNINAENLVLDATKSMDVQKSATPTALSQDNSPKKDNNDEHLSSSLTLLMDHLKYVANCVVEEADRLSPKKNNNKVKRLSGSGIERSIGVQASSSHSPVAKHDSHSNDSASDNSKNVLWQEAMIRELLEIVLTQTDETNTKIAKPVSNGDNKRREGRPKRRVRSNSMDSYCTEPGNVKPSRAGKKKPSSSDEAHDIDEDELKKYQDILASVSTKDVINLLYEQQKQLKTVQMESQMNKLELQETLRRHRKEKKDASPSSKKRSVNDEKEDNLDNIADDTKSGKIFHQLTDRDSPVGKSHQGNVNEGKGNTKLDTDDENVLDSSGVNSDPETSVHNTYTDIYLAVTKQKRSDKPNDDKPNNDKPNNDMPNNDKTKSDKSRSDRSRNDKSKSDKLKSDNLEKSLDDEMQDTQISRAKEQSSAYGPKSDNIRDKNRDDLHSNYVKNFERERGREGEHNVDRVSNDNTDTLPHSPLKQLPRKLYTENEGNSHSPFSSEQLSSFLATAMSVEVQEKHIQLASERTELPIPVPKEFNVYSKRMSELDSLKLQLQKWSDKLKDLDDSELNHRTLSSEKASVLNARLDLTVLTARYLPEMKKISSLLQSSLYAEMTVESINPDGYEEAEEMWRQSAYHVRDDESETTISDISDGESAVEGRSGQDPEEILCEVRQRTLTQWNMKLPDWRTDPLSITFPCHRRRSPKHSNMGHIDPEKASELKRKQDEENEVYFKYLLNSYVVYVTIWSASRSGLDELVARGALPLSALSDQRKHSYWLQLRYPSDIYQAVRSRSKVPDGCSVRIDARLMHSKKLFYLAKISETEEKIDALSRRKTSFSEPLHMPPPPRPRPTRSSQLSTDNIVNENSSPQKALHPVKKVAPYIPVHRERTSTNGSSVFNNKSPQKSPQKLPARRNTPSHSIQSSSGNGAYSNLPPQKKQKSAPSVDTSMGSTTSLPLTKESLEAVASTTSPEDVSSVQKGSSFVPPPNLSIFRGAGVRLREEKARDVKKRSAQAVKKGFGSGADR